MNASRTTVAILRKPWARVSYVSVTFAKPTPTANARSCASVPVTCSAVTELGRLSS